MSLRLKKYMQKATAAQRQRLARLAGTTESYLYQLAGGHRKASAGCAGRLEDAAKKIKIGALPRQSISTDCAECKK
jgi:DNA-binding transcriptional regulator YdaS (Cro superfamily)